ncbi:MAG: CBS domain-containing protein [Sterolibacterium sp.]
MQMMKINPPVSPARSPVVEDLPEMELTDEDILDAMRHIPGYLDISIGDFRDIYHLAHRHAMGRLFGGINAARLMRSGMPTLHPDMAMDQAAQVIARSGYKGLPVVDGGGCVLGMLTETDFLRRVNADTFLGLLVRMFDDRFILVHRYHETPVSAAMTVPAVTVSADAGVLDIMRAFERHAGRGMPVVGGDSQLQGMLFKKDFIAACSLAEGR